MKVVIFLDALEKAYGIPLKEILQMEVFSGVKVLAGKSGLDKLVTGVNVMEVPDILDWVKPGELLLTTGYAIRDDRDAQKNLIPLLAQKGLAGLAIKPKRYLTEIPLLMLAKAEEFDFPLLEIPFNASFSDLLSPALALILNKQSTYLDKIIDAHQLFTKIIAQGGGLNELVTQLSRLMNNTVYANDFINQKKVFACTGWLPEHFEKLLKALPVSAEQRVGTLEKVGKATVKLDDKEFGRYVISVNVGDMQCGEIYLWETCSPLTEMDLITLERLSGVVALVITKENSVYQVERRYLNEFIDQLVSGNVTDEREILERGKMLGVDLTRGYSALIFQPMPIAKVQDFKNAILRDLEQYARRKKLNCFFGTKGDFVVMFCEASCGLGQKENEVRHKKLAVELKQHLERHHKTKLFVAIGRYYPGIKGLVQSYREAYKTFQLAKYALNAEGINTFGELGIYRLLFSQEQKQEVEDFLAETLSPLIKYDREKGTDLVRTLGLYFENNFNLKKVSEKLYTHYNTVAYRLERIKEITGIDLEKADERFNLELALKMKNMFNV